MVAVDLALDLVLLLLNKPVWHLGGVLRGFRVAHDCLKTRGCDTKLRQ